MNYRTLQLKALQQRIEIVLYNIKLKRLILDPSKGDLEPIVETIERLGSEDELVREWRKIQEDSILLHKFLLSEFPNGPHTKPLISKTWIEYLNHHVPA